MLWRCYCLIFVFFLAPATLPGQQNSLTIYHENYAILSQMHSCNLQPGTQQVTVTPIPDIIDPSLIRIDPITSKGNFTVHSITLLHKSTQNLWENLLTTQVDITTIQGSHYTGKLIAIEPHIVLQTESGEYISILPQQISSVVSQRNPTVHHQKSAIVFQIESAKSRHMQYRLTYGLQNMRWEAEYHVSILSEGLHIVPNAVIHNNTAEHFHNMHINLVAGNVSQNQRRRHEDSFRTLAAGKAAAEYAPIPEQQKISEHHMYTLSHPLNLPPHSVKTVPLYHPIDVPIHTQYVYDPRISPTTVQEYHIFTNIEEKGFNKPLPQGKIQLFQPSDGVPVLTGETHILQTPRGATVELQTGVVFDITAKRTQTENQRISDRINRSSFSVQFVNGSDQDATVILRDYFSGDWSIETANFHAVKHDARTLTMTVPIPAEGRQTAEYSIQTRW